MFADKTCHEAIIPSQGPEPKVLDIWISKDKNIVLFNLALTLFLFHPEIPWVLMDNFVLARSYKANSFASLTPFSSTKSPKARTKAASVNLLVESHKFRDLGNMHH